MVHNWGVYVLSGATSDTEPTLLVKFDSAKYLINVGENTTRSFMQSMESPRRTRAIFMTSVGTHKSGGLPGTLMYLGDSGIGHVDLVAPPGLMHTLANARLYTWRETMSVGVKEIPITSSQESYTQPEAAYKDENVTVYAFPINPSPLSCQADDHVTQQQKRKRENLVEGPRKRHDVNNFTTPDDDQPFRSSQARQGSPVRMLKHFFGGLEGFITPRYLHSNDADEWRKAVVWQMFSGIKPPFPTKRTPASMLMPSEQLPPTSQTRTTPHYNVFSTTNIPEDRYSPHPRRHANFRELLPQYSLPYRDENGIPPNHAKPTVAYLIVGPEVRGKFNARKADELGLKHGPMRAKVVKGETVSFEVDDGQGGKAARTVRPEDVMSKSEVPSALLILDIPSLDHIPPLTTIFSGLPFLSNLDHSDGTKPKYNLCSVFHLCGDGVVEDAGFQAFMDMFDKNVQHFVASREHNADRITFTSAAYNHLRLNQLDSKLFPLPYHTLSPLKELRDVAGLPGNISPIVANLRINIRPHKIPYLDETALERDAFHQSRADPTIPLLSDDVTCYFNTARNNAHAYLERHHRESKPGDDVCIVTLGTSSSIPTKYRNVISTLVSIPGHGNILLDAGEGTWGSIARHFGTDDSLSSNAWQALRDLKCIFISHIHGDHCTGVIRLLATRRQLSPPAVEPLYLVATRAVLLTVIEYCDLEDLGLDKTSSGHVILIPSELLEWSSKPLPYSRPPSEQWFEPSKVHEATRSLCAALGMQSITSVFVDHTCACYGIVIKHRDGWSIAYSGDTRPSEDLVQAAQGVTLLIHEASFGDDQKDMADMKRHSTVGQALDVARRMAADNILLTHFSARYPKLPPSLTRSSDLDIQARKPVVAVGVDLGRYEMRDLGKMAFYLEALEKSIVEVEKDDGFETAAIMAVAAPPTEIDI